MAACRDEDDQDCVNILTNYESVAVLLALALQEEDADKFLEVYDHVIPEHLPREEIEVIKDKARELSSLPQGALEGLQKQPNKEVKDSIQNQSKLRGDVKGLQLNIATGASHKFSCEITTNNISKGETRTATHTPLPILPKCAAIAMEGATPSAVAVSTCRNEKDKRFPILSKSKNIWNNNNNFETQFVPEEPGGTHFVTSNSYDILNGNGVVNKSVDNQSQDLSNRDSPVPVGNPALTKSKLTTKSVSHSYTDRISGDISVPPYSKQELFQSAVELIDSRPYIASNTCPKPAFIDPNKPDQVLQGKAGKTDMAAASSAPNTKKTELLNVRLAPTSKHSLPNGSVNNKKPPRVSPSQKVNSVPNDETPLMGNSQRTDSSECVNTYGTNVPSTRNDHLQSSSSASYNVDSDDHQDRGKLALSSGESDGTVSSKPTTLGEQFEASKAQEGKKKKSKKKKKKAPEQEKSAQSPVTANNEKEEYVLACTELPPKNPLISSDSLTSNEEFSSDTGGVSTRPTIASKMMDGSFQLDDSKTPSVRSSTDDSSGSKLDSGEVLITNCKAEDAEEAKADKDNENTETTQAKISQTNPSQINPIQYKTDLKTTLKPSDNINDKIFANDRKIDSRLLNMTAHSTHVQQVKETFEMKEPSSQDKEETNVGDDDGEFQEVLSSRRSRRARKIKGVSMEDKTYTHQNKQIDKDQLRRSGNTSGMRKSSSEPASMARLGETEPEQHIDYLRKLPNRNTTLGVNRDATDKPALVSPPKPNIDSTSGSVMISYAGKVKAGIAQHASTQAPKNNNPVKFTLEDEHSDGHVSDSSIISPQNDAPQNQRTTNPPSLHPSNSIMVTKQEASIDTKVIEEVKPKQEASVQRTGGTSPKFEISFGEFTSVYISGAPKSLKTSCITTSEGLNMNTRPMQKVTRSNSVDGLETEGGTTSEKPSSTNQQHQEANVQYLDLQSANTYASRLKRSLHANPSQGLVPRAKVVEEPIHATLRQNDQVAMEASLLPEPLKIDLENPEKKQISVSSTDNPEMDGVEIQNNQGKSSQVTPSQGGQAKLPLCSTRVENKSHQELKAAHVSGGITASPTPSIASSKGALSSVCFPLNMEPMDLGITFGDVNLSEVLNEQVVGRQDSPVDKIIASADSANMPQVPSTGHSCNDLETAWRDESKVSLIEHLGDGDIRGAENQREIMLKVTAGGEIERDNSIGNFNYYEVADMLMKAWTSTLEQKEANPSQVQYYSEDACI